MDTVEFARSIRIATLRMVHRAGSSHIASAYSIADILAVLYGPVGRLQVRPTEPSWPERDRFILSKGHACAGLYASLALAGFFSVKSLDEYGTDGSYFMSHASHRVPGVELSTGSLGHGLPVGCGFAYGSRLQNQNWRTVVVLSDGELDEGSNWEAILFAGHHRLDQLWAVVDVNGIQSLGATDAIMDLEPLGAKFEAFGWAVVEVDGHDIASLQAALDLNRPPQPGKPTAVIARTTKGKGVGFMEDSVMWHYKSPNDEQLHAALAELEGA